MMIRSIRLPKTVTDIVLLEMETERLLALSQFCYGQESNGMFMEHPVQPV